ncbi:hypothetical protein JZ751_022013 [Albula glossodonta]|uniref:Uncharacterized protein n=1 Tax=Albula glossodonta TaxID=121402 RepID=A0A8T2NM31_9TELE|nr:hypothetical protein JZ751_022013 [Albula glossodonta]
MKGSEGVPPHTTHPHPKTHRLRRVVPQSHRRSTEKEKGRVMKEEGERNGRGAEGGGGTWLEVVRSSDVTSGGGPHVDVIDEDTVQSHLEEGISALPNMLHFVCLRSGMRKRNATVRSSGVRTPCYVCMALHAGAGLDREGEFNRNATDISENVEKTLASAVLAKALDVGENHRTLMVLETLLGVTSFGIKSFSERSEAVPSRFVPENNLTEFQPVFLQDSALAQDLRRNSDLRKFEMAAQRIPRRAAGPLTDQDASCNPRDVARGAMQPTKAG